MSEEWKVGDRVISKLQPYSLCDVLRSQDVHATELWHGYRWTINDISFINIDAEKRALEARIKELETELAAAERLVDKYIMEDCDDD